MVTFVPGRLAPHPEATHPRLHLADYLTSTLPAPPPAVDWYSRVSGWPVYLNTDIGDCTEAMVAHLIEGASTYGQGATIAVTDQDVLAAYERVSGYNPADPSTDQGAVLQDVYADWRRNGMAGHKVLAFAQVAASSEVQVMQAINLFGAAGLGIVVTQDMEDDFNAGHPWTRAVGAQLGGHAVPAVGYDSNFVYVVTWGTVQPMTWGCYKKVTEEAWAAILPEWMNSAGADPAGLDLHALGADLADLTGGQNPFPGPIPTPTPVPSPQPSPQPVDVADEALAAAARPWLMHPHVGANKALAKQLEVWLASKGL